MLAFAHWSWVKALTILSTWGQSGQLAQLCCHMEGVNPVASKTQLSAHVFFGYQSHTTSWVNLIQTWLWVSSYECTFWPWISWFSEKEWVKWGHTVAVFLGGFGNTAQSCHKMAWAFHLTAPQTLIWTPCWFADFSSVHIMVVCISILILASGPRRIEIHSSHSQYLLPPSFQDLDSFILSPILAGCRALEADWSEFEANFYHSGTVCL